jgi:hypothetical protein
LGDKNEVLAEHHFDGQAVSNDEAGTVGFTEFVPWHAGAKRILLKRRDVVLAQRAVSDHAPTVRVLSPNGGEYVSGETTITWEGSDPDGDPLSYTVLYNDGTDSTWWPIATGVTANMISVDTSLWSGSKQGRVMVRATDGVNSAEAVSDKPFTVPQKAPMVAILNADGDQLTAFAYDPEDGLLPASKFIWSSDRDGQIESGRQVNLKSLSAGNQVITLTVADSQGQTATAQVTRQVRTTPEK